MEVKKLEAKLEYNEKELTSKKQEIDEDKNKFYIKIQELEREKAFLKGNEKLTSDKIDKYTQ